MRKNKEELMVKKSNKLTEARYSWNINEQRLVLLLACNVENFTGENKNIWTCRVSELENIFDVEKLTPVYLRGLCNTIMDKKIEIEGDRGYWEINHVLQRAKYEDGELFLQITDYIKPHLIDLKNCYTQYSLNEVLQFDSQYTIRLYELFRCESWKNNKKYIISIEELRRKLGATNKYKLFADFEKYTIKTAVDEINNKSKLEVSYKKIKKGRRIHEIEFTYRDREIKSIDLAKKIYNDNDFKEIKNKSGLDDTNLSDAQVWELYEIASEKCSDDPYKYIKINYEMIKNRATNSLYGYLKKALEGDYANATIEIRQSILKI